MKKEGKTEASACLIDWPVGPVSATGRVSQYSAIQSQILLSLNNVDKTHNASATLVFVVPGD